MQIVTRRQFAKYAFSLGALGSAILIEGCKKEKEDKPLAIDLLGPMAFTPKEDYIEVRMPKLYQATGKHHQAGIQTSVKGIHLHRGEFHLTGPENRTAAEPPYPTSESHMYKPRNPINPNNPIQVLLTMPTPRQIVTLDPVKCKISGDGTPYEDNYAVGLRFLYDRTGKPEIVTIGRDGNSHHYTIPLEPAPNDTEVSFSVIYAPFDTYDPCHEDACNSFNQLSKLYDMDLQVEFYPYKKCVKSEYVEPTGDDQIPDFTDGPVQDCKAPICFG